MVTPTIVIHGGAGTILRSNMTDEMAQEYRLALELVLKGGGKVLEQGGSALDAVTEAVRLLEECPLFNAGKGSVFTSQSTHEMDASIMDGRNLMAGGVASVKTIRNPILAARAVMERTKHCLLIGDGADQFIKSLNDPKIEIVDPSFFYTEHRHNQLLRQQQKQQLKKLKQEEEQKEKDANNNNNKSTTISIQAPDIDNHMVSLDHDGSQPLSGSILDNDTKFGTVGAVAIDAQGNLAAATSTGGMTNKLVGRVGDSPIIGAGCYANNNTVAVSTTGTGEMFMRTVASFDLSALVEYGGHSLEKAGDIVIHQKLPQINGDGGLIAVDKLGNVIMPFNTEGMYRGYYKVPSNDNNSGELNVYLYK